MLYWAVVFFLVSIVAGLLGANNVAGVTMDIAQFFITIFMILAVIFVGLAVWAGKKAKNLLK